MNEDNNNIENTENMKTVVVAQDGSGDYESIQDALFFEENETPLTIKIKQGIYNSPIIINRLSRTLLIGDKNVILQNIHENIITVYSTLGVKNIIFINSSIFIDTHDENSIVHFHSCKFENSFGLANLILVEALVRLKITKTIFFSKDLEAIDNCIFIKELIELQLSNNTFINVISIVEINKSSIYFKVFFENNLIFGAKNLINNISRLDDFETNIAYQIRDSAIIGKNIVLVNREEDFIEFGLNRKDNANILEVKSDFINRQKEDFRLKNKKYSDFGVPNEVILFFMNNEEEPNSQHKPKLSKKEILIYTDTSLFKKEFENFITELKKESEIKNIIPIHSVKELQEQKTISTLVLVSPVDKSENENEIFEILEEAKKQKKQIFIFLADIKKHTGDKMNIAKMPQVLDTQVILREEENVSFYENTEQLEEIIYQRLQTNFPNVTLEKLVLKNIGHFSDLKIDFEESNQNAYCFIGTNGTGKTSILRAIILGLIGTSSKSLELDKLNSLVKIYGLENGIVKRENAFIELHYLVDNKKEYNKVSCSIAKDGKLEWKEEGAFALLDESFLESLIIGFSQLRGERGTNGNKETNRQLRPHVSDLLPLVHNEVDGRLSDFSRWIIDLYAKANEKEVRINRQENSTKKETEILERTTINLVFEIVSQLLDQKIKFKEVRENSEVWVCTELAENGIPISLVSQGFNTIIGWIGGLLQRMQEVYGLHALGRKKEFQTYPAFCLIDELDPHLHPKVQANLMNVLNKYFPNTLFVFSTHSPLIIPYLEKENVFMLTEDGQVSNAHIHTKGRSYQSILLDFMNVAERPKEYVQKLEDLYILIDDENIEEANKKLAEIKEDFGEKDPEILRAQTMIDFIED